MIKIPSMRLDNQIVIMTGGGRGIGQAMAQALAQVGATVIIADISSELTSQSAQIINDNGGKAVPKQLDVTNETEVVNMVNEVVTAYGRIDVLVNSAGVATRMASTDVPMDEWKRIIDINLSGSFLCARTVAKQMIKQKSGRIINVSSILGAAALPMLAAYSASKGGVVQMTKALAVELVEHGITVNAIAPAYVNTEMITPMKADVPRYNDIMRRTPMGRLAEPHELAGPVIFLASEASDFVTGHILYVDGGYTAW